MGIVSAPCGGEFVEEYCKGCNYYKQCVEKGFKNRLKRNDLINIIKELQEEIKKLKESK